MLKLYQRSLLPCQPRLSSLATATTLTVSRLWGMAPVTRPPWSSPSFPASLCPSHQLRLPSWTTRRHLATSCAVATRGSSSSSSPNVYNRLHDLRLRKSRATLPKLYPEATESRKSRMRKRLFFRFFDYLQSYDVVLKKGTSKVAEISRLFIKGARLLYADMKEFTKVYYHLSATPDWSSACKTLSRKQLELYFKLPNDLYKVGPLLAVSALPLAQNVVFPVALMFPEWLLSSHFWTDQQAASIGVKLVERRNAFGRPLLEELQQELPYLRGQPRAFHHFRQLLNTLRVDGHHPGPARVLQLSSVFHSSDGPLGIQRLPSLHVAHLARLHGLSGHPHLRRRRTHQYGNLLQQIDRAMDRETLDALSKAELVHCCRVRGLRCGQDEALTEEEMHEYLERWLQVSNNLDENSVSLLLHLPIFLGHNQRTTTNATTTATTR